MGKGAFYANFSIVGIWLFSSKHELDFLSSVFFSHSYPVCCMNTQLPKTIFDGILDHKGKVYLFCFEEKSCLYTVVSYLVPFNVGTCNMYT